MRSQRPQQKVDGTPSSSSPALRPSGKKSARTRKPDSSRPPGAPEIPDKLYFKIGEVARLCSVQAYVLRFWETEFPQLKPGKSGTGQRLYRRRDVEMALRIKHLLYNEGYTIPGARQAFQQGGRAATRLPAPVPNQLSVPRKAEQAGALSAAAFPMPEAVQTEHSQPPRLITDTPSFASAAPSPWSVQRLRSELGEILGILSTPVGKPKLVRRTARVDARMDSKPQLFD